MIQQRIWSIGALCLTLLVGAGALTVRAGENNPATPSVAVVDMNRVFQASDAPQQLAMKAAEIERAAMQRLKDIDGAAFLPQQDLQEYGQLLAKAAPTPQDQARMKQLREISDQQGKRLQELTGKPQLNDMEKKEMVELTARQRQMAQAIPRIQEDLQADIAARIEAVRRELLNQLREVVSKVAKEKGVTQVFSSEVLIYSTNDLTPQVLQKLKK